MWNVRQGLFSNLGIDLLILVRDLIKPECWEMKLKMHVRTHKEKEELQMEKCSIRVHCRQPRRPHLPLMYFLLVVAAQKMSCVDK